MLKLSKKKLIIIVTSFLVVGGSLFAYFANNKTVPFTEKHPKTKFSRFYEQNAFIYSCSKEIKLYYTGATDHEFEGGGPEYLPVNQEEAKKYCRSEGVIEYRAVIDILKREDVSKTISKYDSTQAWVRALGHEYIHDKDYLKRILPAYSDVKIDCIIVVHSPEGTRFFIEDGERHEGHHDHHYREVPAEEFLASLNNASSTDVTNFWLGLH